MALTFDRADVDQAADDALQVVDLGDILIDGFDGTDESLPPAHGGKRRRATGRRVAGAALAGALGLGAVGATVVVVRSLQDDQERPGIDIQDRERELPANLEPPVRDDEPPATTSTAPPSTAPDPTADLSDDPGGKAAFKEAVAKGETPVVVPPEPGTQPSTGASTGDGPATSAPSTTASTTTSTTVSDTLPDGSPNPLGPGPDGSTDPGPDPFGSDELPGVEPPPGP